MLSSRRICCAIHYMYIIHNAWVGSWNCWILFSCSIQHRTHNPSCHQVQKIVTHPKQSKHLHNTKFVTRDDSKVFICCSVSAECQENKRCSCISAFENILFFYRFIFIAFVINFEHFAKKFSCSVKCSVCKLPMPY